MSGKEKKSVISGEQQFVTFYLGELLMAIPIGCVQEINRQLECTPVPQAPSYVCGVVNLRGEVVTVVEPRQILRLPAGDQTRESRNLIINSHGESVGIMVDKVSDILTLTDDGVTPPPANLKGVEGRFFIGVHQRDEDVVVLLNIDEMLSETYEYASLA
ncbi:chemotaxis protein CheW [Blastopirellula marina]|uniref:Chemotaxis protein CheW n=1 Tax=Blastopirellula marina TaxID=124 RepID=A0A2S8FTP7_9BACT|nr:chemotaxis protein CheW [Blastopirellula marina]PQO35558.1 chemotaxis protein CheW [Blastopirellula marina]PQO48066.1 chemotaxis protein CheW [Blastopirellula marina]PTL44197.1 chemotaxis protein CheW [Blastopirellula marina]